ncbi:uncharacterized protein BDW43DRAFT_313173 [Aspergillus alliaceus]|uniref:uncharacterized protein n=1 Tax=Petromyces alliaceus TaxID=209559 RepID=UPI0012A49608|nr:uncharacterized protein BDW43DRAFT_313173 [Aspergillus alliaceus]KAB8231362.1 hypothetical protein BDW43DRAFT_313173 [Aspergillus alliaceus]
MTRASHHNDCRQDERISKPKRPQSATHYPGIPPGSSSRQRPEDNLCIFLLWLVRYSNQKAVRWGGPYAVSKAAGIINAVQLNNELHADSFTVIPLHPGLVATDMGNIGGCGGMPVDGAVRKILNVIQNVN